MHAITEYIVTLGYIGIAGAIFAESGLLVGIFLPGDSLLFTAGLLASQGYFNIFILVPLLIASAIIGDNVGYYIGKRFGPALFVREDSFFFKKSYLEKTEQFYKRYGKKTILLARFVPIVRTLAPMLAGAGSMQYQTFFFYNVMGGFLWAGGITSAAYWLGSRFSWIETYLEPILIAIIVISFLPMGYELIKSKFFPEKTTIPE